MLTKGRSRIFDLKNGVWHSDPETLYLLSLELLKSDNQREQKNAFKYLEKACAHDHPQALFTAYQWYLDGVNCVADKEKALTYLQRSATQGNPQAMVTLGNIYRTGLDGVEKDCEKALDYYLQAANMGNMEAQFRVGKAYAESDGCEKNCNEAKNWYEKAAAQGHDEAMYCLGQIYGGGRNGIVKDYEKAFMYYLRSAPCAGLRYAQLRGRLRGLRKQRYGQLRRCA